MNGWTGTITVEMQRRRAKAKLYTSTVKKLELSTKPAETFEEHDCYVLFASQEMDTDSCTPVFVCEFNNGRVYNVPTEDVRFVDTDENGSIIDETEVHD